MQTRHSKCLRDETASEDDAPLSPLISKQRTSASQPHANTESMQKKGKEKVVEHGSSSKA